MTTDTTPEAGRRRARRLHRRRHGEGLRDDPPDLATMLAVVTTDYPLAPGEAIEFLRPAVEESFNAISVDGECSTNDTVAPARERRERRSSARRRPTRPSPRRCTRSATTSPRQIVADGEGVDGPRRDRRHGRRRATPRRRRSRAGSPPRRSSRPPLFGRDANWGRVLDGRRLGAAATAATRSSTPAGSRSRYNGTRRLRGGAPAATREPDVSRARSARSSSTSASATGSATLPRRRDLSYDYVRINAEYRT